MKELDLWIQPKDGRTQHIVHVHQYVKHWPQEGVTVVGLLNPAANELYCGFSKKHPRDVFDRKQGTVKGHGRAISAITRQIVHYRTAFDDDRGRHKVVMGLINSFHDQSMQAWKDKRAR